VIIFLLLSHFFVQTIKKLTIFGTSFFNKNIFYRFNIMIEKESNRNNSFYKIDYEDTHTKYYRLALLYVAILFPFSGLIYRFLSKDIIDPIWMRFTISGMFFTVYFLSFKIKFIYKEFVSFFNICLFIVFFWAIYIASVNEFNLLTSITFIMVASINTAAVKKAKYIFLYSPISILIMSLFFIHYRTHLEMGLTIIILTITIQFVIYLILKSKSDSEKLLILSEKKIRYLVEALGEGIGIINKENIILYNNPSASEIFGTFPDGLFHKKLTQFVLEENQNYFNNRPILDENNSSQTFELHIKSADNKEKTLLVTETLYNLDINDFDGTIMVFRDITDRKLKEKELKEAKAKAEESDHLKSAFLANMSHEIRTPMNGILGFTDLMRQSDLTGEELKHYSEIINKCCNKLLRIINDIIDISKIEAGMVEAKPIKTDLNDQLQLIYQFFKHEAEAKGLKIFVHYGLSNEKAIIKTDVDKFYSITTNLVKNAIKYSHKGQIDFGYSLIEKNGKSMLQFFVKDTGIGIPQERQQSVFERFVQADIEDRNAYQGSGLGLSIAKAYVEMLQGKIWVESEEGFGSSFYFTIPYCEVKKEVHTLKIS